MEQFDEQKAARVWQRVQKKDPPEPLRRDITTLIRATAEQAAYYRNLSRAFSGTYGDRLREYGRQQQRAADCLLGICRLSGIAPPAVPARPQPPEPPIRLLEKCCHSERRLYTEYRSRSEDPDWGRVYEHMAADAAERCCGLLGILGGIGRQGHPPKDR